MRRIVITVVITAVLSATGFAELQNVQVGGALHIRGVYLTGPANDNNFVEQRSRINVKGEFTDDVSAYLELDSYDIWGEDFRSANYITGADARGNTADDVEVFQSYIDVKNIQDSPLSLRIGRQAIVLGDGWLIGDNASKKLFTGLSFDAVNLTYATDTLTAGAVWAKGADLSPLEQDGDVDLYVAYANYTGIENTSLLGYWIYGRDARSLGRRYDPSNIHTVGAKANGQFGAFDYNVEAAYQFGEADQVGFLFNDPDANWDVWAGNLEAGYTFDVSWAPRVFLGGVYFGGEDNRDNLLAKLFPRLFPEASVSFNRLFSGVEYGILDWTDLSNVWIGRGGVKISPTEKLAVSLALSYFETIDSPDPLFKNISSDLGWETALVASYAYSSDLTFRLGWEHLFAGDGIKDGNFVSNNGLISTAGVFDEEDTDLVFADAEIKF